MMNPIPHMRNPERYDINEFKNSDFVELNDNDHWVIKMQYPILGMKNAESRSFVRREVYEHLIAAARLLPRGYRFCVWDCWRPFALQQELYEVYSKDIIRKFKLENSTKSRQTEWISKFVSLPAKDREVPPVHTTGGAIDLTLIDGKNRELDMGTNFDDFSETTKTSYFETTDNYKVRDNRRLLFNIMIRAGFTNLPSEWWHFDYGDRFWAYYKNTPAIYRGVFEKAEMTP